MPMIASAAAFGITRMNGSDYLCSNGAAVDEIRSSVGESFDGLSVANDPELSKRDVTKPIQDLDNPKV
jgi:hypothetical protein